MGQPLGAAVTTVLPSGHRGQHMRHHHPLHIRHQGPTCARPFHGHPGGGLRAHSPLPEVSPAGGPRGAARTCGLCPLAPFVRPSSPWVLMAPETPRTLCPSCSATWPGHGRGCFLLWVLPRPWADTGGHPAPLLSVPIPSASPREASTQLCLADQAPGRGGGGTPVQEHP